MISLLLSEIHKDRCGESVQEQIVHGIVHSFVLVEQYKKKNPLALYGHMLEENLLKETGEYYRYPASLYRMETTELLHDLMEEVTIPSFAVSELLRALIEDGAM